MEGQCSFSTTKNGSIRATIPYLSQNDIEEGKNIQDKVRKM